MCWALNHQNTLEMAQGHISLSNLASGSPEFLAGDNDEPRIQLRRGLCVVTSKHRYVASIEFFTWLSSSSVLGRREIVHQGGVRVFSGGVPAQVRRRRRVWWLAGEEGAWPLDEKGADTIRISGQVRFGRWSGFMRLGLDLEISFRLNQSQPLINDCPAGVGKRW
jgi:hypothetical protein